MKKLSLLLSSCILLLTTAHAQNPLVKQWDKRFGGTKKDIIYSLKQTNEGGYIIGGYSSSGIGGDKTQATWALSYDFWIVNVGSIGNKQWDKDFGGTGDDFFNSLQQTLDGGFILGGRSISGIGGDKTQNSWGQQDYWVIKIDSLGNKQWDKDFGASENESFSSLKQTIDGGYILGGWSFSGINGDKTQDNWDTTHLTADYWVIKIDSLGNKLWDKTFGGINHESLTALEQTIDRGYILGGYSWSGISGNKTEASRGLVDYWIIKIDSLGNKQWDKRYGGTDQEQLYSLNITLDGGYVLGGWSQSDSSGDKTQNNKDTTGVSLDYWIVKIDAFGSKQWDKTFGGANNENDFGNVSQTSDGGYIISGTSYSNISGDKTENNLGMEQTWIVKADSIGNKQWDKTIFTMEHDEQGYAIQTTDGCYVIANSTKSGIGGYKTQLNWDTTTSIFITEDYWLIKFCDSTLTTSTNNINHSSGFNVYPNPFTNNLNLSFSIEKATTWCSVRMYDVFGREVLSVPYLISDIRLQTSHLSNGIYLLEVITDKERIVKKVVKQ